MMPRKDYEPITLGGLIQSDWEVLMQILDTATDKRSKSFKYQIQCKIDISRLDGDWK